MLVYLSIFILLLCVIHIFMNHNKRARMIKKIPGPKDDFIIGNAFRVMRSSVELMNLGREYAKKWKGIYRIWIYPFAAVVIYNPEDIEVIVSNMKYNEKSLIYMIVKPWLCDGLLLSNGTVYIDSLCVIDRFKGSTLSEKWQQRRKILTPAFHFNILRQFCVMIEENTQRLLEKLKQTSGESVDIVPILSEFTLNAISETAMGTPLKEYPAGTVKSYKKAIYELGNIFFNRFIKVYLHPDFIFYATPFGRKQNRNLKIVHAFTEKVIQQRKDYINQYGFKEEIPQEFDDYAMKKKKKTAMLDLLISAEKDRLIDNAGIQEEVDTFMFEGHDTTASGLTMFLMLLANHKNVQNEIVSELNDIFGDSKRAITMADLPQLKYLERCIKESLRLYPPVHFISRKLNTTTVLSNYTIPAGSLCHIPIYDLHHSEELYENPEEFNPDRFLPENSGRRHPYAYIPFSAGPRNCIGQKFAMMEMKIAVAEILREFELEPVTKPSDIRFLADLVLRNDGPVQVKFIQRR